MSPNCMTRHHKKRRLGHRHTDKPCETQGEDGHMQAEKPQKRPTLPAPWSWTPASRWVRSGFLWFSSASLRYVVTAA